MLLPYQLASAIAVSGAPGGSRHIEQADTAAPMRKFKLFRELVRRCAHANELANECEGEGVRVRVKV
jgi:hypothetical protein